MKKKAILFLSGALLNVNIFAGTPLPRGKNVLVRITSEISSKYSNTQNTLAVVDNDVKDSNGTVLIKAGTPVELQVNAQKARGCGRAGTLSVSCISTTAVDGQRIILNASSLNAEGKNKKGLAIGLGVGTGATIILPIIGFAFLAIKGGNATIPANTLLNNVITGADYNIE